jgi:hypothetical protein
MEANVQTTRLALLIMLATGATMQAEAQVAAESSAALWESNQRRDQ